MTKRNFSTTSEQDGLDWEWIIHVSPDMLEPSTDLEETRVLGFQGIVGVILKKESGPSLMSAKYFVTKPSKLGKTLHL